jgi:hypothetical protein
MRSTFLFGQTPNIKDLVLPFLGEKFDFTDEAIFELKGWFLEWKTKQLFINSDICFIFWLLLISCGQLWFQETAYIYTLIYKVQYL